MSTSPNEFILTDDFNIYVDDPLDSQKITFSSLASFNLTQRVIIPTHTHGHILDLIITAANTLLSLSIFHTSTSTFDQYPIFSSLNITPNPLPSFNLLHISPYKLYLSFISDLFTSQLITNPPITLHELLSSFYANLRYLLDKHAPLITKITSCPRSNP